MGASEIKPYFEVKPVEQAAIEKLLLQKLLKNLPHQLEEMTRAKMDFIAFCEKQFLPYRERALQDAADVRQMLSNRSKKQRLFKFFEISSYICLIIIFSCALFHLASIKFLIAGVATIISLHITIYFYEYLESFGSKKLGGMISTFERDRNVLERAGYHLSEFKSSLKQLQDEIKAFVTDIGKRYLDVYSEVPEIKRFLRRVVNVDSNNKNDVELFLREYKILIRHYNAVKYINDQASDSGVDPFLRFLQACSDVEEDIQSFLDDTDFYFTDFVLMDAMRLPLLILLNDPEKYSQNNIENLYNDLCENKKSLDKALSNVKQKIKIKSL